MHACMHMCAKWLLLLRGYARAIMVYMGRTCELVHTSQAECFAQYFFLTVCVCMGFGVLWVNSAPRKESRSHKVTPNFTA